MTSKAPAPHPFERVVMHVGPGDFHVASKAGPEPKARTLYHLYDLKAGFARPPVELGHIGSRVEFHEQSGASTGLAAGSVKQAVFNNVFNAWDDRADHHAVSPVQQRDELMLEAVRACAPGASVVVSATNTPGLFTEKRALELLRKHGLLVQVVVTPTKAPELFPVVAKEYLGRNYPAHMIEHGSYIILAQKPLDELPPK